jgi:arsenite-transporting ATPase
MEVNPDKFLQGELEKWEQLVSKAQMSDYTGSFGEFQEWLSGIPGVDEATALASVIDLIESGEYDIIVFDTAPTGHTLKLMGLPQVLQVGIEKLQSVQTKMWSAWNSFAQMAGNDTATARNALKRAVERKLLEYKAGVEKVGRMMKDQQRTAFVVVCIAEYLSISESQRLLEELKEKGVRATHVCVNQLVTGPTAADLAAFEEQAGKAPEQSELWKVIRTSMELTSARAGIQGKYLKMLQDSPEAKKIEVVKLPLLPKEVTGPEALLEFFQLFVSAGKRSGPPKKLVDRKKNISELYADIVMPSPCDYDIGDRVLIKGLVGKPEFNGLSGTVRELPGRHGDGRIVVLADLPEGGMKKLLLKEANIEHLPEMPPTPENLEGAAPAAAPPQVQGAYPAAP